MAVNTTAGARFYIGPVDDTDALEAMNDAAALAHFEAIVEGDWTEVEEIESFGDFGDTSDVATFASVADRRVRKFKTTKDAGTLVIVVGRDALDEGQIALIAAEGTDFNYSFRIVYNDARAEAYSPSTEYFAGMVLSKATNLGGVADITKRTFNIGVNSKIINDDTDPTGS